MSVDELTRRSLLRGALLAVGAGAVGFLVARHSGAAEPATDTTAANGYGPALRAGPAPLGVAADLPLGGGVVLAKAGLVLTRDTSGVVHAFSATCTHQGCTVSTVAGGTIDCPCHGSRFDIRTGAVVQGPATRPLPAIPVTVRNGRIVRS